MTEQPYEPELGQFCFGQPSQRFSPDRITMSAIACMQAMYDVFYKEEDDNPFHNSGEGTEWKSGTIHIQAYSWGDDDQPYNLAWREFRLSWYKHACRGLSVNHNLTQKEAVELIGEFLKALVEESA